MLIRELLLNELKQKY